MTAAVIPPRREEERKLRQNRSIHRLRRADDPRRRPFPFLPVRSAALPRVRDRVEVAISELEPDVAAPEVVRLGNRDESEQLDVIAVLAPNRISKRFAADDGPSFERISDQVKDLGRRRLPLQTDGGPAREVFPRLDDGTCVLVAAGRRGDDQEKQPAAPRPDGCIAARSAGLRHVRNWSGKRGSNPRHPPWQGGALPLSYSRSEKRTRRITEGVPPVKKASEESPKTSRGGSLKLAA